MNTYKIRLTQSIGGFSHSYGSFHLIEAANADEARRWAEAYAAKYPASECVSTTRFEIEVLG
jgi:hypothetical protein